MQQRNPWDNDAVVPAGGGMVITKAVTPKEQAETQSAQARAREAAASAPYLTQGAADDASIKHAQALVAQQKADEATAQAKFAAMVPNSDVHGDAYLQKYVPASMRATVQAYARGDLGSRAGGITGQMLPIIQHAINYDPSFSATTFPARSKMQADLAGNQPGTAGGALRSMEQMLLHGSNVLNTGERLNNAGPGIAGSVYNAARTAFLSATHDPTLNEYQQEVKNYAPESQKGVAGAAGIGAEREERAAGYGASLPQASRAAALQADARMALERIGAVNDQYKRLMGRDITDQLSPAAKKAYDQIMAGGYDAGGNALHPAAGYTPGGVFGAGGTNSGSGSNGTPPSGPGGMGIGSGPGGMVPDPDRQKVVDQLSSMLASGRSDDEVTAFAKGAGIDPAASGLLDNLKYRRANHGYGNFSPNVAPAMKPQLQPAFSLNGGTSPLGTFAMSAANALTGNTLDNMTADPGMARAGLAGASAANPTSGLLGDITGAGLAAAGTELGVGAAAGRAGVSAASPWVARGADALFGGVSGAGAADDGSRLGGGLLGAGAGVGGGMFGRGLARGASGVIGGVRNADTRYLAAQGVPLTVGQTLADSGVAGRFVKGVEDRLTGIPGVGNMVNARRREGMEAFNRAAFDQALAPIGASTNGAVREAGVDAAQDAVSNAYGNALNGVRLQADQPFVSDMRGVMAQGNQLPDPMGTRAGYTLNTRVGKSFDPNGGLTGNGFQQSVRGLRRDAAAVADEPYGYDFGQVTNGAEGALEGMLNRQSPGTLPAYRDANTAYRNASILQDAVNRGRSGTRVGDPGLFAPSQLTDAAAANSRRFGNNQGTTNQPFFDLTRAGQRILPSSIADSGTAGRMAVQGGLAALGGAGLGAGAGFESGDTATGAGGGLALAGLLAAGGTRAGQRALTSALLTRPAIADSIAQQVLARQRLGGMFGAGLGLLPVTGQ